MANFNELKKFLITFMQEQAIKANFHKTILGISGGVDSAVVAILAKEAFGENFYGFHLPSSFSSPKSFTDAKELCDKFDINLQIISIDPMLQSYINNNPDMDKLRMGNLSARLRMATLYDMSAKYKALVIGTSNKSELLLGYGTVCGDLAAAFNPIGELYKGEIFAFGEFLGVTEEILKKAPSADLWEGQKDEEELGVSYEEVDKFLKDYAQNKLTKNELEEKYSKEYSDFILGKIEKNIFKGKTPAIASARYLFQDF